MHASAGGKAILAHLPEERIEAIRRSMCTVENPLWYSHRRAALAGKNHEGRMLALIQRQ